MLDGDNLHDDKSNGRDLGLPNDEIVGRVLKDNSVEMVEFEGADSGVELPDCRKLHKDKTNGDDVRASIGGARNDGTACETESLHMCHLLSHVVPSPSSSCGRACGLPSVGSVGALGWVRGRVSARSAWGCCPGCGLYGDRAMCMACDVDTHGGTNSGRTNSSANLRVVRRPELRGGMKSMRAGSGYQVGSPILDNASGDAGLADYLR